MTDAQQKECLAVLLKADIFSAAGEMELASVLLDFSELRSFKKDEIIYSPQNPEKCIGVLIKGEARVTKDYVTMSVLHPGQQFGTVVLYHKTDYFVNTIPAFGAQPPFRRRLHLLSFQTHLFSQRKN